MNYEPSYHSPNPKFPEKYPQEKTKYSEYISSGSSSFKVSTNGSGIWVAFSPDAQKPAIVVFSQEIDALRYVVNKVDTPMKVKFLPYGADLIKVIYE